VKRLRLLPLRGLNEVKYYGCRFDAGYLTLSTPEGGKVISNDKRCEHD
jgi:hypothetical protein